MSKTLVNQFIKNTYTGILHSEESLPETGQSTIYDGDGNESSLKLGRACNGATICGTLTVDDIVITGNALLNKIYPIGSVYLSIDSINPTSTIGGSWSRISEGRFIVGVGTDTDSNNLSRSFQSGENSGEYSHRLTVAEMPSHTHNTYGTPTLDDDGGTGDPNEYNVHSILYPSQPTGGDQPHNNVPPSFALYIWKRIA